MFSRRVVLLAAAFVMASSATVASAAESAAPFGIDKRPMPSGSNLETLLPAKVGAFAREPLSKDLKLKSDEDVNVTYRAGNDSIDVGLSKPESIADARDAIEVTRDEAVQSKVPMKGARTSLKTDPAYFHAHDFISWTRGTYFFYAKASSPEALARFMAAFPY
jgi:hypothetical protein